MQKDAILIKLTEVFREVFDLDDVVITPDTVADDIEEWDSLEHISLISAVERTFKMKFKMKEVSTMKNVGEMIDIIAERTKLYKQKSCVFFLATHRIFYYRSRLRISLNLFII